MAANDHNSSHEGSTAAPDGQGTQETLSAHELMGLVKRTIDSTLSSKFAQLEAKASKPDSKKLPDFRFKGNKVQAEFIVEVRAKVSKASRALRSDSPLPVDDIADLLDDIKDKLDNRTKLIRIGDSSGWDVVEEYLGNDIASDSDDERKLRSAEARALRKRKASQISQQPFRRGPRQAGGFQARANFPQRGFSGQFPQPSTLAATYALPPFVPGSNTGFGPQAGQAQVGFSGPPQGYPKPQRAGPCYYCGRAGHWAAACPDRKK